LAGADNHLGRWGWTEDGLAGLEGSLTGFINFGNRCWSLRVGKPGFPATKRRTRVGLQTHPRAAIEIIHDRPKKSQPAHSDCPALVSANGTPPISILGFDGDPTPPSKRKIAHGCTVKGPHEYYWETDLLSLLEKDSALQSVTLRHHFQSAHPLAFPDDRIRRTLERWVRQWRALSGPECFIVFRQTPEPGYMGPAFRRPRFSKVGSTSPMLTRWA